MCTKCDCFHLFMVSKIPQQFFFMWKKLDESGSITPSPVPLLHQLQGGGIFPIIPFQKLFREKLRKTPFLCSRFLAFFLLIRKKRRHEKSPRFLGGFSPVISPVTCEGKRKCGSSLVCIVSFTHCHCQAVFPLLFPCSQRKIKAIKTK